MRAGGELGQQLLSGGPGEKGVGRSPINVSRFRIVITWTLPSSSRKAHCPHRCPQGRNGSIMLGSVVPAGPASWQSHRALGLAKCSATITFFLRFLIIVEQGSLPSQFELGPAKSVVR